MEAVGLSNSVVSDESSSSFYTVDGTSSSVSSAPDSFFESSPDWYELVLAMLSHLLNGYLTAFCVVTGVALNLFSIFIFVRCGRGSTPAIQYYLVTLTMWQTALLCNAFLLYSLPNLLFGHLGTYVYIYPFVYTFANTTHTGSVWIVLTLTVDRYLALCQPLKHRAIGKRSRVKRLMIVVSLMACLFSLPRFFEIQVESHCTSNDGCEAIIARADLFYNRVYWSVYHVVLAMLFVTLCPCLLLFGLTLRISVALRHAILKRRSLCPPNAELDCRNKRRSPNASRYRKDHKSNIMLVLVISKFLVSDILPTVADVVEHIIGNDAFMRSPTASLFVDVSNFLLVLNCSTNFWVFIIWGKRFRRSCRQAVFSSQLGRAIYKLTHMGSNPDLVSICGPSSFTTVQNTTKIYGSDGKHIKKIHLRGSEKSESQRIESGIMLVSPERRASTERTTTQTTWGAELDKSAILSELAKRPSDS